MNPIIGSRQDVERIIKQVVMDVTSLTGLEESTNLLDRELSIFPADFLYIFDLLERELQVDVYSILRNNTYRMMTVGVMADELYRICKIKYIA